MEGFEMLIIYRAGPTAATSELTITRRNRRRTWRPSRASWDRLIRATNQLHASVEVSTGGWIVSCQEKPQEGKR